MHQRFRLLCCEIFVREASRALAESPHDILPLFTPVASHANPAALRSMLQDQIDAAAPEGFDAVLLGFGLCGNATAGLVARGCPLVIARAHDCATLCLGSRDAFARCFGDHLSAPWGCPGYQPPDGSLLHDVPGDPAGNYQRLAATYGTEHAADLRDALHANSRPAECFYIDIPETSTPSHLEAFRAAAAARGSSVRVLPGDMRLIRALVNGQWDHDEFLVVAPGMKIDPVYDWTEIVREKKA